MPAEKAADNGPAEKKTAADGKSEPTKRGRRSPKGPQVALVEPDELVLGSPTDKSPTGYRLEVQLEQKGAGVEAVELVAVRGRVRRPGTTRTGRSS